MHPKLPVPRLRGRLGQVRCRKASGAVLGDAVSKMANENTKVQLVESCLNQQNSVLWLYQNDGCPAEVQKCPEIGRLDYEPCNVNYFENIVTFAIEVNSLQTAVESIIF